MSNKNHKKLSAWNKLVVGSFVAVFSVAILFAGNVLATWGPSDRPTFLITSPADYVTFNSITNQTPYGDERNFMVVREAGTNNKYTDEVDVESGKEYEVYVHYHNNAKASLNASGVGMAQNARLRVTMDALIKANSNLTITGIISADNAKPKEVWDDTFLKSKEDVAVRYVPGSATIHSAGAVNGQKLSEEIFGASGVQLGYDSLNGQLPGCNEFSGYVTFRLKIDKPDFSVSKKVRLDGSKDWVETVNAQPGQKVNYLVEYKNTGTMEQVNVVVKDKLPIGAKYVAGTTKLKNAKSPDAQVAADGITTTGLKIGGYLPGANALMSFSATMPDKDQLSCGTNKIRNIAEVLTENGGKNDAAEVIIDITCEKPIEVCNLETNQIIKIDEKNYDESKHSKDLNKCAQTPQPTELPSTGPAQTAMVLAALTGAAVLIAYELQKRRKSRAAFANHIAAPAQPLLEDGLDDEVEKAEKLYVRKQDSESTSIEIKDESDTATPASDDHSFDSDETHRDN